MINIISGIKDKPGQTDFTLYYSLQKCECIHEQMFARVLLEQKQEWQHGQGQSTVKHHFLHIVFNYWLNTNNIYQVLYSCKGYNKKYSVVHLLGSLVL